jgi:tetratricopeptide (TPR) repeat protein
VPKVIDFGVAKATTGSLTEAATHTGLRQMIGTLEYMSPEQADLRDPAVDTRSDIYSLGVLLYELLTGTAPFDPKELRAKGYSEAQRIIRQVEPRRPSSRLSTLAQVAGDAASRRGDDAKRIAGLLRGDLDRVVMKCLEKDRERRYASAAALADDVRRYLEGEPVSVGPDTATYRVRKLVVKHKALVAALTAIAVALVFAIVGTSVGLLRARAAQYRAELAESSARQAQSLAEQHAITASREAQRATTVSGFLGNIFALAEPESGAGGENAKVDDVLRRAADQIDVHLQERPEEQLVARRMLGEACSRIYLHDVAAEQFRRAHELSVSLAGGATSVRSLDLAAQWATSMYVAGKGADAAPAARTNLADCQRVLGERNPVTWEAMHSCALCISQTGDEDGAHDLLERLVAVARQSPDSRKTERLGRYLCNWAVCLRDRGDYDGATAALREAASLIQAEDLNRVSRPSPVTQPAAQLPTALLRLLGDRSSDIINSSGWIAREMVESGSFPGAIPLLERFVSAGLVAYPQGTPTIAYRLEDLAMLKLQAGDRAGAGAAFARAIDMSGRLHGFESEAEQSRWRMWAMSCCPQLADGWQSPAVRSQVWAALDDLLRDNPPPRLVPEEISIESLHFKLIRWSTGGKELRESFAEGDLDALKALADPPAGLYLLGLEVPRLGDEPLRRANWLLMVPWSVELHPIARFDGVRTDNTPVNQPEARVVIPRPYDRRQILGLALNDGLTLVTEPPRRRQWFTAIATARVELPAGKYRFSATSDDGVRLAMDGRLVVDHWAPRPSGTSDGEAQLAGGPHDLRVDFFQETGGYALWVQAAPTSPEAKAAALALGGGVPAVDSDLIYFAQQTAESPRDRRSAERHALALARRGRFRAAAAEYATNLDLDPTDHWKWYDRTTLLAYAGDSAEYRAACRGLFDRFSSSPDPAAVVRVLAACAVRSDPPLEEGQMSQLLGRVTGDSRPPDAFTDLVCGMAQYRAGRFDEAVTRLRHGLDRPAVDMPTWRATAEMVLAMALHRIGDKQEAQAAMGRARHLIETEVPTAGVDDLGIGGFENWLICQTIWREANSVVGP